MPGEVVVHMPTIGDIGYEEVARLISKDGVELVRKTIRDRVLERFVSEHEGYIAGAVEKLLESKRDEIKRLLV